MFEDVVLTPNEEIIIEALGSIEPRTQRIASLGFDSHKNSRSRGGIVVRLAGSNQRIPIGSTGDGMWRILGLALAIVNAKDGVLLVDEIDTGLHFSAMADMWKLIWETAQELDVQVFATTHNNKSIKPALTLAPVAPVPPQPHSSPFPPPATTPAM
jgi:predicted ATPase